MTGRPMITIILSLIVLVSTFIEDAAGFDLLGIDILNASRDQITLALTESGANQLPSNDHLMDRYDSSQLLPGAKTAVHFTADGTIERIVHRFDAEWFVDVTPFEALKSNLIDRYGKPTPTPAEIRNSDFEEELLWTKDGISIRLISYKWFAAWRVHVTHRLSIYRIANGARQRS